MASLRLQQIIHQIQHRGATALYSFGQKIRHYAYIGDADAQRRGFYSFGPDALLEQPTSVLMGVEAVSVGAETLISADAILACSPEFAWTPADGPMIDIGDRVWAARGLIVTAHRHIWIGDDVWFGPRVFITDASHEVEDPTIPIGRGMQSAQPIRIGHGSWIGSGVCILPGVTIGNNCVIGANAVVTSDIADNAIAVGVPAREVRQIPPRTAMSIVEDGPASAES